MSKKKIKIGDKVRFGDGKIQGLGVVTRITRPEGFRCMYTVKLLVPGGVISEDQSYVNEQYDTYYVEKDNS